MISASLGSATRYISITRSFGSKSLLVVPRHRHRARRLVVHHDDARAGLDRLLAVGRVGEERLDTAADRHHHLAHGPRGDPPRHPSHLADDVVLGRHETPRKAIAGETRDGLSSAVTAVR